MLPKGVYDALPWLYMAIGALTAGLLESEIKYLPALIFFVAGVLVLSYRRLGSQMRSADAHSQRVRHSSYRH